MEYQRRFLVSALPASASHQGAATVIRQVYWALGEGWVLRLRRSGDSELLHDELALKGPRRGMGRPEFEFKLREAVSRPAEPELQAAAEHLYRAGSAHQVVKTRHRLTDEHGTNWVVDQFHAANEGLLIAELEGRSPDEIADTVLPSWVGDEITDDARYNNERLAFAPWTGWAN